MSNLFQLKTAMSMVFTLSIAACTPTGFQAEAPEPIAYQEVENLIAPWVSDSAPGVSVAVSWNDDIVFARGAGLANVEHGVALQPDSVFQVASVSKQFTAFATLLLVSEGKIDLEADIRTYIPELKKAETVITVRHLLDHTGGLRERNTLASMAGWLEDDVHTEAQFMRLVTQQRGVNFAAGTEIEYSNTGYALLAEIVARVSGTSFKDFMQERVFEPLGMQQSSFTGNRNALIPGRAASYYPDGDTFKNIIVAGEAIGSTGLYTTALDLLKWAENFETQDVGKRAVFDMMSERFSTPSGEVSTFAKGHELRMYKGLETWSHGGRDAGYRSFLLRVPSEDFEVAIISNRTDFDTAKLAFTLSDSFLSTSPSFQREESEAWTPASAEQLASYAGDYEFYPGVIFSLRFEKDGLTFASLGENRDELEPLTQVGQHQFVLNAKSDISLKFETPLDGKSASMDYVIGLHGAITSERIELAPFAPTEVNISEYTGTFESNELHVKYKFLLKDGQLYASHNRLASFALVPYQTETFSGISGPLQKVEFFRGQDGQIDGFFASAPLAERVEFRKVLED